MREIECWFLTAYTRERWPTFRDPYKVHLLAQALREVRDDDPFEPLAFVVLPDHVHGLWTMERGDGAFARRWTALTARIEGQLGRPLWHAPPLTRRIDDASERIALRAYIHFNPVRHGLVANAAAWPYSTVRAQARHRREAA